ncbi:MAG: DNA repair exonuclease [Clostridiales bacterium]
MRKCNFIHCSDIHLDSPFSYFGMDVEKSDLRRRELRNVFKVITDLAIENKVDFLIISGDLYEHKYINKSTILFINDLFEELNPIKIFIAPGNHDPYLNNSYYKNFNWSKNVIIFNKENKNYYLDDIGVRIHGVGFENYYEKDLLNLLNKDINREYINILVTHGTLDLDIGNNNYNPISSKQLEEYKFDYIALGHFHTIIKEAGRDKNIFNPGCPEPLKFGDSNNCGVYITEIEKNEIESVSLKSIFINTNKRFFEKIYIKVDGVNSDNYIIDKIIKSIERFQNYRIGSFMLILNGKIKRDYKIDIKYINEKINGKVFYFKVIDNTDIEYDLERLKNDKGLCGVFVRKTLEKIKTADDEEKELLKKALDYGIELIENGKLDMV